MNKEEFRDFIRIRFGLEPENLPKGCNCTYRPEFNLSHALSCKLGGHVIRRHNDVRDTTRELMKQQFTDVSENEEFLLPLTEEEIKGLKYSTARTGNDARPDLRIGGLFQSGQQAYTDFYIFDSAAPSYLGTDLEQVYKEREAVKNRAFEERIRNIDHGKFYPSVASTCGGLAKQFDDSLSILAEKLSEHHDMAYSHLKMLMRVKVQFSIIRGVVRCIRGTRRRKTITKLNMQDPFLRGMESANVEPISSIVTYKNLNYS